MAALYPDQTGSNIRFSFRSFTTKEKVDRTVDILKRVQDHNRQWPYR